MSKAVRIFAGLFVTCFLVGGAGILLLGLKECWQTAQRSRWPVASCQILTSAVTETSDEDGGSAASFLVTYQYSWNNQSYTGDVIAPDYPRFNDYTKAYDLLLHYPPGSTTNCLVPPNAPEQAILFLTPSHATLTVLVGILTSVVSAYLFQVIVFHDKEPNKRFTSFTIGFFSTIMGSIALWFTLISPALDWSRSLRWATVPCEIEKSSLVRSTGGKGSSVYRPDIVYRYTFEGHEFKNNRVALHQGSSSGKMFKEALLAKYPVGTKATCFVNPSRPWEAMLTRGLSWAVVFSFLGMLFLWIGLYMLRDFYRSFRRHRSHH